MNCAMPAASTMNPKSLIVVTLILTLLQVAPSLAQSRHLIAGTLSGCAGSKILYSRTVWQKAVPGEVVVSVVTYPPPGVAGVEVINFINAANQDMTDAGQARIVSGGVGQQQVKIEFKSRVGHGFNFVLKIYGKKVAQ